MSWLDDFVADIPDEPTIPRLQAPSSGSRAPEFSSSEVTSAPQTFSWVDNFFGPAIVKLGALFFAKRPVLEFIAGTGVALAVADDSVGKACKVTISNGSPFTPPTGTGLVTVTGGVLDLAAFDNTGTGFFTITSGTPDIAATANIRYTGGKFQTDVNAQWKNGSITGDLAWAPTSTSKTLTLPDATDTIVGKATTDDLSNKTLILPKIKDASTHNYIFAVSTLAADRTVTLPLLTADDTLVFATFAATLSNKTLASPVVTGSPVYQGTRYKITPVIGEVETSSTSQTILASLHHGRRVALSVRRDRDLRAKDQLHEGGHLEARRGL